MICCEIGFDLDLDFGYVMKFVDLDLDLGYDTKFGFVLDLALDLDLDWRFVLDLTLDLDWRIIQNSYGIVIDVCQYVVTNKCVQEIYHVFKVCMWTFEWNVPVYASDMIMGGPLA